MVRPSVELFPTSLLILRPSNTYKSFDGYCDGIAASYYAWKAPQHPGKLPCMHCRGAGRIYDPNDPPCPIEGNKMRDVIKCPRCDGTRYSTREEWLTAYKAWRLDYTTKLKKYNQLVKSFKSALRKLTKSEIKTFQSLGLLHK